MALSLVTAAGVDAAFQRRSRRLLTACIAASLALHLALLAAFPGFVENRAPLEVRALEVVLLKPEPSPAAVPEPLPPAPARPVPPPARSRDTTAPRRIPAPKPAPEKAVAESPLPSPVPAPAARPVPPPQPPMSAPPASEVPGPAETARAVPRAPEVTPPTFAAGYLRNPAPRYPLIARRNGEQGTVTLRVLVTRDGAPARVSVERTSGSGHLDSAAVEAVKGWRFVPARQGEQPIDAWVLVPIVFRLEGAS